jgi:D-tyrosyl-tRNA(Tyr) deacylase
LVISQFTLHASTKKGNRPSFLRSADPAQAAPMIEQCCELLEKMSGVPVKRGVFGADMQVSLCNDGPVTIVIDSRDRQ